MRELLWRETSTLGVRGMPVRKWMLERRVITVSLPGGKVRVKLGLDGGRVVNVAPEYADCARLAAATGRPPQGRHGQGPGGRPGRPRRRGPRP